MENNINGQLLTQLAPGKTGTTHDVVTLLFNLLHDIDNIEVKEDKAPEWVRLDIQRFILTVIKELLNDNL